MPLTPKMTELAELFSSTWGSVTPEAWIHNLDIVIDNFIKNNHSLSDIEDFVMLCCYYYLRHTEGDFAKLVSSCNSESGEWQSSIWITYDRRAAKQIAEDYYSKHRFKDWFHREITDNKTIVWIQEQRKHYFRYFVSKDITQRKHTLTLSNTVDNLSDFLI